MSATLMKALAKGELVVRNRTAGEVMVHMKGRVAKIGPDQSINLLLHATEDKKDESGSVVERGTRRAIIKELRRHKVLKRHFQKGILVLA